jgi:glycosyltransferase involved in cell wall biosynthesis
MKKILFMGAFSRSKGGAYGGIYFASTTLKEKLESDGYDILTLDTAIKDLKNTSVLKRLPYLLQRNIKFINKIISNTTHKILFVYVSAGNSYLDKFLPILIAKIRNKKVFVFPRSGHVIKDFNNKYYKKMILYVYNKADYIICQSAFWKDFFINQGINEDKLKVVENWVDNETIAKSEKLDFKNFSMKGQESIKIVFISRIETNKGIYDILNVASALKGIINFEICIYGSGSFEEELLKEIKHRNLERHILFKGWLSRENMLKEINIYDLAIFTSQIEGYPNVILDYVFSKVPILAADVPIIKAVSNDNIVYYQPENIIDFKDKIIFCYNNFEIIKQKSINIYNEKRKNNNVKYAVGNIENIIKNSNL